MRSITVTPSRFGLSGRQSRLSFRVALAAWVSVLVLPNATLRAGTPNLSLAMLSYRQLPMRLILTDANVVSTGLLHPAPPFNHQPSRIRAASGIPQPKRINLPVGSFLQKTSPVQDSDFLFLTRTNPHQNHRSRTWTSIEAGYGEVFCDAPAPTCGRNGTGWEEPSYGYLKISFSF